MQTAADILKTNEVNAINGAQVLSERLTWEEFLQYGDEDTWAEWIDGRVTVLFSG
jgi:hypothetical protein